MSENQRVHLEKTLREIAKFHFVLDEGRKGNHLLFDPETIRSTFVRSQSELVQLFETHLPEINNALNQTFQFQTFEEKRDYIRTLPQDIQQSMIFGYFQLLDGNPEGPAPKTIN